MTGFRVHLCRPASLAKGTYRELIIWLQKGEDMRNYILTAIALLLLCAAWKGFEYLGKRELLLQRERLKHDSEEREKDRELQREIMKAEKEKSNPK
jgi:hypothetical protein